MIEQTDFMECELSVEHVDESGTILNWKGEPRAPEYEGVVCKLFDEIIASLDWEDALDEISVENMWVDPAYRDSPIVLLKLIRYLDERYPRKRIIVGEYANPKAVRLIRALNRRHARRISRSLSPDLSGPSPRSPESFGKA